LFTNSIEKVKMRSKIPTPNSAIRAALAAAAALALVLALAACGESDSSASDNGGSPDISGNVSLVAYSTPQDAYEKVLEPGFQAGDGAGVEFSSSFGASGDQSRAVEAGQPADLVHFAIEPDMKRLVDAGLVDSDWTDNKYNGVVEESVVAFTVRKGNPKDIQDWDDLVRDDVEVITPNPFTSGGARWNIMAAYGAQIEQGKSPDEALQFVADLLGNTGVQDPSAADALATFSSGKGDVLISYENEAIRAQQAGEDVDYVIPDDTIRIETVGAVTSDAQNPEAAQAFLDYLWTPEGQQQWADEGYRPVDPKVLKENADKFPTPKGLFDIESLGGWDQVTTEFFDPENGSVAEIERNLGVSTG
jgi:sulfate transport system substrate-binding protein